MAKISPSLLGADFARLGEEVKDTERAGADMLHLDIMDGHFVPNISYGSAVVATVNGLTDMFLDVHLMLSEPEKYFAAFAKAGADAITFHIEARPYPADLIAELRGLGVQTGLSLNPDHGADLIVEYLDQIDYLLVMSVFPGFGGQSLVPSALETIRVARKHIDHKKLTTQIVVDGGIDESNAAEVVAAGADILVMGSAFYGADDRPALVQKVHGL
jgi:ribulose-phosphate 3-epimerase